jgi:hypothetical protein
MTHERDETDKFLAEHAAFLAMTARVGRERSRSLREKPRDRADTSRFLAYISGDARSTARSLRSRSASLRDKSRGLA